MTNIQIILNAILSKNIFEYLLIDRDLKVLNTSVGALKYMENVPYEGDDILMHIPEFLGFEEKLKEVFDTKDFSYTFKTVHKNGYYMNISLDHYNNDVALVLLQNITKMTQAQQQLLQYSNETTLLYHALQKIIDAQNSLLFVTNSDDRVEFANQSFLHYFHTENLDEIKAKALKLYHYVNKNIKSYNELHKHIRGSEIHLNIGNDTFIMQSTAIEETHRLFTLSRVTDIYEKKKSLETEVEVDTLTGVYRKKYFDLKLEQLLKEENNFALIVVDIDDFKAINDNYGHTIGDDVLKEFSSLLKKNIRQDDLIARWGGEEFLLALKIDDLQRAMDRTETLRKMIDEHAFKYIGHLTASFGLAWRGNCDCDDANSLLQRADKALYKAKNNGKNKVILKKLEKRGENCIV